MSIRLDPDLKAILQKLADADERSLNAYINRALRMHADAVRGKKPKTKG
jgi:predicted transcriptional regulator